MPSPDLKDIPTLDQILNTPSPVALAKIAAEKATNDLAKCPWWLSPADSYLPKNVVYTKFCCKSSSCKFNGSSSSSSSTSSSESDSDN